MFAIDVSVNIKLMQKKRDEMQVSHVRLEVVTFIIFLCKLAAIVKRVVERMNAPKAQCFVVMDLRLLLISLPCLPVFAVAKMVEERIEVIEQIPPYQRSLSKVLPQQKVLDETRFSADSLATLLQQSPLVSLNGQGGLFQTINIRGFARWRIQMLVEGIPIYTERRAGTSVEFVPPSFVEQAHITQGAASTQLGSGAIGGGVDLSLAFAKQPAIKYRQGNLADYREVQLEGLTDNHNVSWMLNHRHANNSRDGDGGTISDGFEQHNILIRHRADSGHVRESFLLYSSANNIAKASADDVTKRSTIYPSNDHILAKLQLDWLNMRVYLHDSKLQTVVKRPTERVNMVVNDSLDMGVQLNEEFRHHDYLFNWRAGIDARTGVKASERETAHASDLTFEQLVLDAQQFEAYLATEFSNELRYGSLAGGVRMAQQRQRDTRSKHTSQDTNLSAFIGYIHHLNDHWQWAGYLSQAYRVPSLTERYFHGSTPRGTVMGATGLATEKSFNTETSLSFQGDALEMSIGVFQQNIDDYIERLRIAEDLLAYRNVSSAIVHGVNYQGQYEFDHIDLHWTLSFSGQWLDGENQQGMRIADISPAQHRIAISAYGKYGQGFIALTHRQSSEELAEGELPRDAVSILDAGYDYQVHDNLTLALHVTNLTNRLYATSRDDLAPFAKGRDIHLTMRMTF